MREHAPAFSAPTRVGLPNSHFRSKPCVRQCFHESPVTSHKSRSVSSLNLSLSRRHRCLSRRIKEGKCHHLGGNRVPHRLHGHLHLQRSAHRRLLAFHACQRNHLLQCR